jgi:hypothetical protein
MKTKLKKQLYLIHNVDSLSLEIVGGPFATEREREEALIELVSVTSGLKTHGTDTVHALDIKGGKPAIADYVGGYMENIRWIADGCKEDEKPSTWQTPGFALLTHKKMEKRLASK